MSFDPKVIEALAVLRTFAQDESRNSLNELSRNTAQAINTLDDAGVFAALDEQTDYASAEEILADPTRHQGLITELKNTPLDEPLFDSQAEVYGRLLGGTTGGGKSLERVPGTDTLRLTHEHVFRSPHSDEICYGAEGCLMTYREYRAQH